MAARQIRGRIIESYFRFIKKAWGEAGVLECMKATGIDPKSISELRWYDVSVSDAVIFWIAQTKGAKNIERCGAVISRDLGFLKSLVVRLMSVDAVLKHAPSSYDDSANFGRLTIDVQDHRAVVVIKDGAVTEYSCPLWVGMFTGLLEMTKTKGSVTETQCQLKGAPHCEFVIEWQ